MTEEDAKTKWCPFVRVMVFEPTTSQNPPVNRETSDINCIGSACMAWRWDLTPAGAKYQNEEAGPHTRHVLPDGRCGLAR